METHHYLFFFSLHGSTPLLALPSLACGFPDLSSCMRERVKKQMISFSVWSCILRRRIESSRKSYHSIETEKKKSIHFKTTT
jgi:hypothetical protein